MFFMKKMLAAVLSLVLMLSVFSGALAVNEDIDGKIVIYTSMYQFEIDKMTAALKQEFPNLDVSFFYGGTGDLQTKIAGEMGDQHNGVLSCDMLMVAEPAYSLELKDYGYLEKMPVDAPETLFRDGLSFDPEGYWYPVRTLNMVLAYNPEKYKAEELPKTYKDFAESADMQGQISMSNPLTSGTAMAAIVALSDKYGYEYFDQTPLFTTNQVQYFESGVAFAVHLSTVGARKVSYPIEEWMKKTMNIYNDNLYK
jgi:iron(III) transport system substrate-binding protein